ncbi:MAG: O-antigen ligase family protein [Rhodothermia bacterium]|nr:O-antigen ligase family protein [Rhodothermia bacterium]
MPKRFETAYHIAVLIAGGLYVGLTPLLSPYGAVRLYDLKRVLEVALLVTACATIALIPVARRSWLLTWRSLSVTSRLLVLLLVLVGLVSAAQSTDVQMGVLEVVHLALLAVFVLLVASCFQRDPKLATQILAWVLFVAAGVYTFWFLKDYLFSQLGLAYSFRRGQINALWPNGEFLGYAHPRFFNQVQTILIPVLALPVLWGDRGSYPARYLLLLVLMLWWTMVFASGSRGTIVSCGVAFVATAPFFWRSSLRYYVLNILAFIGGLTLFWIMFKVLGDAPESIDQRNVTTSSERFNLWRHAIEMFRSDPVLGAGPMQYASMHATWGVHPHNALMQFLSEWGGVATAIVAFLAFRGVGSFVKLSKSQGRGSVGPFTIAAVTTSALAAMAHAMLSGVIVMPASQVSLILILGWSIGLCLGPQCTPDGRVGGHRWRASATIITAATLIAAIGAETHLTIRSFEKRNTLREAASEYAPGHKRLPRFWLWGCINDHSGEASEVKRSRPVSTRDYYHSDSTHDRSH